MEIKEYLANLQIYDKIDPFLYDKYNVKRGLRNADGTGVLVGLTRIGEVHGYIVSEEEKTAVEGKLFYRGIDVEKIVSACAKEKRYGFEEVVFLLLFGVLPTKDQLERFSQLMGSSRELPESVYKDSLMKFPSKDIMNVLARSVLLLYSYDENPEDRSYENILRQCIELISKFPAIIAYAYRTKTYFFDEKSLIIHRQDSSLHTAETILDLMRRDRKFTRLESEILDLMLIIHAEHGGGNNSTFSVHLVSSTDTDTYSAISTGLASLKGVKHGGANAMVMAMMDDIEKNVKDWTDEGEVTAYLEKILRCEAGDKSGLIYGIGHAVYTISDPRAVLLKTKAEELAKEKGLTDELNLYKLIDRISPALIKKHKKTDKNICANVDFYSGFVYKMLNIPPDLYTPLFAVSRVAGWCAHRLEEVISGRRIIRPAYKCVQGHNEYINLEDR